MSAAGWVRWWPLALALLARGAMVEAQEQPAAAAPVVLTPGDLVRITVWQNPDLSGEFIVTPEGSLSHPLYQTIQVVGVPLPVAKVRLHDFLAETFTKDPLLTVEPLFRVSVGGEVRSPNLYTVPRGTTVAQAVALAGGVTERGKASKVRLLRRGSSSMVDLTRVGADSAAGQLASGDQVIVSRSHSFVRDFLAPFASLTSVVLSIVVVARQ